MICEANDIEKALDGAHEVPLEDMTQEELWVVILHDPDLTQRRAALRMFKLDILADAEIRIMNALAGAKK